MSSPRLLAAMAAHLPRLPFLLLFVFLAVHVPASHGDPLPTTYTSSMCSESFKCGGVEIRYPLYLSNATEATADYSGYYSCGYTDLNISCQGEGPSASPVLHLSGENYTVQNISYGYDSGTIILADSDVLAGSCPAVRHNVSFDDLWLHNTSSNDNLTFYFGCYGPRDVPPVLETCQIDCIGFKSPVPGGGVAFVFTPDNQGIAQEHGLASLCGKVVSVLVQSDVLMGMVNNWATFTSGGYGVVLKQGFELSWSLNKMDKCYHCENSGGQCAYSQKREFMTCLCSDTKVGMGNLDCKNSGAKNAPECIKIKSEYTCTYYWCFGRCCCCCRVCCRRRVLPAQEEEEERGQLVFEAPQVQRLWRDPAFPGRRHGVRQHRGPANAPLHLRGARAGDQFLR